MPRMDPAIQFALAEHRLRIRSQWEKLLRLDRGVSALARPDTMVHLLDTTLDELYAGLRQWSPRRRPTRTPAPVCPCGRNPFLAYFAAGRQAVQEGLITVQTDRPGLTAAQRDEAFACLDQVLTRIARRDLDSFCAVCQFNPAARKRGHRPCAGE